MRVSGRWAALAHWGVAFIIMFAAGQAGIGALALSLIPGGLFIWFGIRAYKSVGHW